ncbi:OmpA family protein [Helicobacter sp. UBA3407]|uniref:OmpA/MotB family protein n=2 Tax=Helicobacter TaxID=209 RepID=UPI002636FC05|nr:OmpA family protein [Helicobacter sp. UBA3407]
MDNSSNSSENSGEYWLTISDLMSGLMVVFLFISVAFMRYKESENDKIKNIAITYEKNQTAIHKALHEEFKLDLKKWNASINGETLSFKFNSPEVLFKTGSSEINRHFQQILSDFIPRFLKTLGQFNQSIQEVRIEGHTSSEWQQEKNQNTAYFKNMQLSQERTLSILKYSYYIPQVSIKQKEWIKSNLVAVGFSSSKIIVDLNGIEDKKRSRRVTFRIITNADSEIRKILTGI